MKEFRITEIFQNELPAGVDDRHHDDCGDVWDQQQDIADTAAGRDQKYENCKRSKNLDQDQSPDIFHEAERRFSDCCKRFLQCGPSGDFLPVHEQSTIIVKEGFENE